MNEDRRYPIGRFEKLDVLTESQRAEHSDSIARMPAEFRRLAEELGPARLAKPYREGGWTGLQVAHHVADSHMNAYIRFKWALTEEKPTLKAYDQEAWVRLPDATAPADSALRLLEAVHGKWVSLLRGLGAEDFRKEITHPESGLWTLDALLALYEWHGRHHLAHLRLL
jgi:hypothetical protein